MNPIHSGALIVGIGAGVLLGLVALAAGRLRTRAHRMLFRLPTRRNDSCTCRGAHQTVPVTLRPNGFDLPGGLKDQGQTAFLEMEIETTVRGAFSDPFVEVLHGGDRFRQYFERGAVGRRRVNISPLFRRRAVQADDRVTLRGRGLRWRAQGMVELFDSPPIDEAKVLVLAPHPDDAEIAAFGMYAQRSSPAWVATMTGGDRGMAKLSSVVPHGQEARWSADLRVWDSLTIPELGGVPRERCVNFVHPDGALRQMHAQPAVGVGLACEEALSRLTLRARNAAPEFQGGSPTCTWRDVVEDLRRLLEKARPGHRGVPAPAGRRAPRSRVHHRGRRRGRAFAAAPEPALSPLRRSPARRPALSIRPSRNAGVVAALDRERMAGRLRLLSPPRAGRAAREILRDRGDARSAHVSGWRSSDCSASARDSARGGGCARRGNRIAGGHLSPPRCTSQRDLLGRLRKIVVRARRASARARIAMVDSAPSLQSSSSSGRAPAAPELYARWHAFLKKVDAFRGVGSLRTLRGLGSWPLRWTFARFVVESRLGIPNHGLLAPTTVEPRVVRDGYTFEPRDGTTDREVLWHFHEVQTRWLLRRYLAASGSGGVFVDVGAHCGSLTIPFESSFDSVLAIEPMPDNYRALERNISLNGLERKIRLLKVAAGAASAVGTLFIKEAELHSLLPLDAPEGTLGSRSRSGGSTIYWKLEVSDLRMCACSRPTSRAPSRRCSKARGGCWKRGLRSSYSRPTLRARGRNWKIECRRSDTCCCAWPTTETCSSRGRSSRSCPA